MGIQQKLVWTIYKQLKKDGVPISKKLTEEVLSGCL